MGTSIRERRIDGAVALGLFALSLGVYLRTLCPSLYWGDCGELASAAYTLGITHPTGYPLWCLLAKAWTLLPFGTIIWRLNVFSAVCGALAVVSLYGCGRALTMPRSIAAAAAGLFAFSHTFWQQCLFCETYSLTAFYTCTNLFLAARWRARGRRDGDLRLLAFSLGLTLTNHQTNTLFLPGFIAFLLWCDPTLRRWRERATWRRAAPAVGLGLLPLLFYIYLPVRAAAHPAVNWSDPETAFQFFYHVTGRQYTELMFHQSYRTSLLKLAQWAAGLGREFSWPLVALAVWGLARLWIRTDRPAALLLSWMLLADLFFTIHYKVYNHYIYFIPSYIVLALSAGCGAEDLWQRLRTRLTAERIPALARLSAACLLILVPFQAAAHWAGNDLSHDWTCYDYGRNLLASVAPHGVVIDNSGDTSSAATTYLQTVERFRTDVVTVKRPLLFGLYDGRYQRWTGIWILNNLRRQDPEVDQLFPHRQITIADVIDEKVVKGIIAQAIQRGRPVYALSAGTGFPIPDGGTHLRLQAYLDKHYDCAQIGLLERIYRKGDRPSDAALLAETECVWRSYRLRGVFDGLYLGDDFLTPIALDYYAGEMIRARIAFKQGNYAVAEDSYQHALRLFKSREAAEELRRCAEARQHPAPTTSARSDRHPASA